MISVASALVVIDKENPRWQAKIDRWKSGPWLKDGRVGFNNIESTIWYQINELQKWVGG